MEDTQCYLCARDMAATVDRYAGETVCEDCVLFVVARALAARRYEGTICRHDFTYEPHQRIHAVGVCPLCVVPLIEQAVQQRKAGAPVVVPPPPPPPPPRVASYRTLTRLDGRPFNPFSEAIIYAGGEEDDED